MADSATKKRKATDAVVEALSVAQNELDEREAKLQEREEALRKAIEGVEEEKKLMAGRSPRDIVPLNIGGSRIHVLRKTLCLFESSMLAAQFSGRWDDNVEKDDDGFFFIDQPSELFMPLINFLRAKAIEAPAYPVSVPEAMKENKDFQRLVEYYGLTPGVFQHRFVHHLGAARALQICNGVEATASCDSFISYKLDGLGHSRAVQSYTVVIGETMERPQIGWMHVNQRPDFTKTAGVGEFDDSYALDRNRGGIVHGGSVSTPLSGLTIQAGTAITCRRRGAAKFQWLIDGAEVATISPQNTSGGYYAMVSGQGEFKLTDFSYETQVI